MIDFKFRRVEVIVFFVFSVTSTIVAFSESFRNDISNIVMFFVLGYLTALFLVGERKTLLIFNRDLNRLSIIKKALFRNEYKIEKKIPLDSITGTHLVHTKKDGWQLHLDLTSGESLEVACGYFTPFHKSKIEDFLSGEELALTVVDAPFGCRLFGIMFAIAYVVCGMGL